ncbi:hypothetical protein V6Z90_006831 [Aspergillus fumigatus]
MPNGPREPFDAILTTIATATTAATPTSLSRNQFLYRAAIESEKQSAANPQPAPAVYALEKT